MSKLQKFVWIKSSKWPRQLFVHAVHLLSGLCCSAASQSVISTHTEILSSALAPEVGQVCTKLYNMLSHQNSKTASAHTHKHTRTRSALQSKWDPGIQISEFQMQLDSPLCLSSYTPPPTHTRQIQPASAFAFPWQQPETIISSVRREQRWNFALMLTNSNNFCTHFPKCFPIPCWRLCYTRFSFSGDVASSPGRSRFWGALSCQVKPYFKEARRIHWSVPQFGINSRDEANTWVPKSADHLLSTFSNTEKSLESNYAKNLF